MADYETPGHDTPALRKMYPRRFKGKKNMTWTPNAEDWKLMQELKSKTGIANDSDVMRMGLRKLAEAEGLR